MKPQSNWAVSFLIPSIGNFVITCWRFCHGDSLDVVWLNAFLTIIFFLIFIYLDLKKGA